eukprot:XP_001708192.1 Hypothetical protein GL50803_31910 [Giardia lamblia ATCC 50803]
MSNVVSVSCSSLAVGLLSGSSTKILSRTFCMKPSVTPLRSGLHPSTKTSAGSLPFRKSSLLRVVSS